MHWTFLGNTGSTPLESSLKSAGWSRGLRRETGVGYVRYIVTPTGDHFAPQDEAAAVDARLIAEPADSAWMRRMDETTERLRGAVRAERLDVPAVLALVEEHFARFLVALDTLTRAYDDPRTGEEDRRAMETWRNDPARFDAHEELWPKLAAAFDVPLDAIERASCDELLDACAGAPLPDLTTRRGGSLTLEGDRIMYDPRDLRPVPEEHVESGAPLQGKTAFGTGKLRGTVGADILVATMTTPDMLPIVRGMRAVVTDDGGVLCHAAITCRELRIPCIIATGDATKVLRDGDSVELDLDAGTVRR